MSEPTQVSNKAGLIGLAAAALVGIGGLTVYLGADSDKPEPATIVEVEIPEPTLEPTPEPTPEPIVESTPEPVVISYPTPEPEPTPEPTPEPEKPTLETSDRFLKQELNELVERSHLLQPLAKADMIRKFVVFTDNAAIGEIAKQDSPMTFSDKPFAVEEQPDGNYQLDSSSYSRYNTIARLVDAMPTNASIALYRKFKPLFQEAYGEIGYPDTNFDDTLIKAIEVAIETPVVEGDVQLIAPSAMYQFADPDLEELQPIQKLLIRMGPKNQLKVQAKLEKLRKALLN